MLTPLPTSQRPNTTTTARTKKKQDKEGEKLRHHACPTGWHIQSTGARHRHSARKGPGTQHSERQRKTRKKSQKSKHGGENSTPAPSRHVSGHAHPRAEKPGGRRVAHNQETRSGRCCHKRGGDKEHTVQVDAVPAKFANPMTSSSTPSPTYHIAWRTSGVDHRGVRGKAHDEGSVVGSLS